MKLAPLIFLGAMLGTAIQNRAHPADGAAPFPKPADLPINTSLPDPLVMLDGRKVGTREMWFKQRRPELILLFQHYMYGQLPPKPAALSSVVDRVDPAAFGGKATLTELTLKFERPPAPPIHLM